MGDVIKVNFKNKVIHSVNGKPTGFRVRTRAGRTIGRASRASTHEKIFHGAVAGGAALDYFHGRHEGLNRPQSAAVSGLGAGIHLTGHHVAKHLGAGWKTQIATDVASSIAAGAAQQRLRTHYAAKNRQKIGVRVHRRSGRF